MVFVDKSDPTNLPRNYRPISLLSTISKVFKKLLYIRLEKYLSLHNVVLPSSRVGQYRGTVTRYFFSTFIGTVGTL